MHFDASTPRFHDESFSCLVAEISKGKAASAQRRAKVTTYYASSSTSHSLFVLRVEYPSATPAPTASSGFVPPAAHDNRQRQGTVIWYEFNPSVFSSRLTWIDPQQEQESSNQNNNDGGNNAAIEHEYTMKLESVSRTTSRPNQAANGNSSGNRSNDLVNCLVTFERFLEVRVFARQMHWLLEVRGNATSQNEQLVRSSCSPCCAMVGLPIRWWFEAWQQQQQHSQHSIIGAADNTNSPSVVLPRAHLLTSPGPSETTWHVRNEGYDADSALTQKRSPSSSSSTHCFYSGIEKVLPLLESPQPTQKSDDGNLQWASVSNPVALASAMEGSLLFGSCAGSGKLVPAPVNATRPFATQASQQQQRSSDHSSTIVVTSRNIAALHSVQGVLHDSISHRISLAGKNAGSRVVELCLKQTAAASTAAASITGLHFTRLAWKRSSRVISAESSSSSSFHFVAVPLQEAIVEASSAVGSNEFVLGPATHAVGAAGRVVCIAADSFAGEPAPLVLDTVSKSILVVGSTAGGNKPAVNVIPWATALVRACTANPSFVPLVLLPLRGAPGFLTPGIGGAASPTSPTASAVSTMPSGASNSLESILLLSALRECSLGGDNAMAQHGAIAQKAALYKLVTRAQQQQQSGTISVIGAVGTGKSTLIRALSSSPAQKHGDDASLGDSSLMSDDLLFGCRCRSCTEKQQLQQPQHKHSPRRLIQASFVEAPSQAAHATAGIIANSDIVLCVVNCLMPHSLSWAEERLKPILEQHRNQTLNVDGSAVHYGGPTAILVTVNSGSYRRTIAQDEIAEAAARMKCIAVADLDFGSGSDASPVLVMSAASSGGSNSNNNRLASFSPDDARIVTATIGKAVQASAAYTYLLAAGFLPLHAEWVVTMLVSKWDEHFAAAAQALAEEEAGRNRAADTNTGNHDGSVGGGYGRPSNSMFSTAEEHTWLARAFFGDSSTVGVDEALCDWIEADMDLVGSCRYSIADVAEYIAVTAAARDLRGQLVRLMIMKRAVSSSSSSATVISFGQQQQQQHQDTHAVARRSKKMARKLFAILTANANPAAGGDGDQQPPSALSTGRASSGGFSPTEGRDTPTAGASSGTMNVFRTTSTVGASPSSAAAQGLTPVAVHFALSTFGIIVPLAWVSSLWAETSRMRAGAHLLSLNAWLRIMHLFYIDQQQSTASSRMGTPRASSSGGGAPSNNALRRQASIFTTRHMNVVDFSFVAFHWALELAKCASSELLGEIRNGWIAARMEQEQRRLQQLLQQQQQEHVSSNQSSDNSRGATAPVTPTTMSTMINHHSSGGGDSGFPPIAAVAVAPPLTSSTLCRSCKTLRPDTDLIRCVVCERHVCLQPPPKMKQPCCLPVGGREADQKRNALLAVARTVGAGGGDDDHTSTQNQQQQQMQQEKLVLKKLPHVCRVCLLAHSPAPWQPDEEATSCYVCNARFTFSTRRHHCRQDGRVVCGDCSRHESAVFGYPTAQRICINCYNGESPFKPLGHSSASSPREADDAAAALLVPDDDDDDEDDDDENGDFMFASDSSDDDDQDENRIRRHRHAHEAADDDDDDDDALVSLSDRDSIRNALAEGEDPRVVFAPWAHLVLNSEPDTVFRQPWYETLDEAVVEGVLAKVNELVAEAVRSRRHVPRAEYVVRQPGLLESDSKIEDELKEWPEEFEPED